MYWARYWASEVLGEVLGELDTTRWLAEGERAAGGLRGAAVKQRC